MEEPRNKTIIVFREFIRSICSIESNLSQIQNLVDNVLTDPEVKEAIMQRNGRVNIRPDSGDPIKIICGDKDAVEENIDDRLKGFAETVNKGLIQRLYEI